MFFRRPSKFEKQFEPHLKNIIKEGQDYEAVISIESGQIVIELFVEDAPNHVANFVQLARSGKFDDSRFYRVVDGFVAQTGVKGGEQTLKRPPVKAEINHYDHLTGMVSMAHGDNIDGAKGEFFICLGDIPSLDGTFTIFGKVKEGMEHFGSLTRGSRLDVDKEFYQADFEGSPLQKIEIREKS